jgi:CRISPR/Cas system CSM-associated protein Csm3 (group 7 of RAMP superfamily)
MKRGMMRFTLELLSPLRVGSGSNDPLLDAPVVRDAFGDYRVPGSSLAGAVRAHLEKVGLGGLFGEGGDASSASAVEFSDGFLVDWDGTTVLSKRLAGDAPAMARVLEVQDRVRIDHTSGTAAPGGKFDAEVVPLGLRFRFEIGCVDRGGSREPLDVSGVLGAILAAFEAGDIRLGAEVTNGLGMVKPVAGTVSHDVHDLATPAGLVAARSVSPWIDEPLRNAGGLPGAAAARAAESHAAVDGTVRILFRADGPILVGGSQRPSPRSGDSTAAEADLLFGHTLVADYARGEFVSRPWIPGSSVKGVLRHRVRHVLEATGRHDAERCVDAWFGSVGEHGASPSLVRVHGQVLDDEKPTVVQHVAIDRLTGGSLQGALYAEAPIWREGLIVDVTLELNCLPVDGAAALAHALLDMGTGSLPIGGGVNRGNGRLMFAAEEDPARGFHGRAVRFDVMHEGRRYTHTDGFEHLQNLERALDASPPLPDLQEGAT